MFSADQITDIQGFNKGCCKAPENKILQKGPVPFCGAGLFAAPPNISFMTPPAGCVWMQCGDEENRHGKSMPVESCAIYIS